MLAFGARQCWIVSPDVAFADARSAMVIASNASFGVIERSPHFSNSKIIAGCASASSVNPESDFVTMAVRANEVQFGSEPRVHHLLCPNSTQSHGGGVTKVCCR